jgi:hypothetical protein
MHLTAFVERGYASSVRMSRGIQIPEDDYQACSGISPIQVCSFLGQWAIGIRMRFEDPFFAQWIRLFAADLGASVETTQTREECRRNSGYPPPSNCFTQFRPRPDLS